MELGTEMSENPSLAFKRGIEQVEAQVPDNKRRRSAGPEAAFYELLTDGGCELSSDRSGHEVEVLDARKLRRSLEQKLTLNADLRGAFMEGLAAELQDPSKLHAFLRPMTVTSHSAPVTGDSLARVLLNVASLQQDVATLLLERLSEFDSGGSEEERTVAQLILGQFRWLDQVVDSHGLTDKVLQVLPVWPQELQREAITFLPEIAPEEDYEAVLNTLGDLMQSDNCFILPAIDAVSSLSLGPGMQAQVVEMVMDRIHAADPEDLPVLVRFLLQNATAAAAKTVVSTLRDSLHFAAISDPRLPVPDRKQKGKALGPNENPEYQLLDAIKQGMQLNPVAAEALTKEIRALTEPGQHKILDFWVILLLLTLGPDRRKAAEAMLRKKLAEGHAEAAWMERAIAGHEKAMGEFFPTLLALAQQLVRASADEVAAAGTALYVALFTHFSGAYHHQEMLRALHAHLGAHVPAETDAALAVLSQLAQGHTAGLLKYAAFLTNILDFLDGYSDAQTHKVFAVFSELVAYTCQQSDETGGSAERSRMEDELFIFLRKQLSGMQASHRRVGIIGVVGLVQRLGDGLSEGTEHTGAIGKRYEEAMVMLNTSFTECQRSPESFAFLCDELARSIQQGRVSRRLMQDLFALVANMFEEKFIGDLSEGASVQVGGTLVSTLQWWNLDGEASPATLRMLPLLAEQASAPAGTNTRNPLIYLFSTIRLMATTEAALNGGQLESIDALLGCPVTLFPMELASPPEFEKQAADMQRVVLLGIFYALNWYREMVNAFAAQLATVGTRGPSEKLELKLLARLRGICQLEALLDALLAQAPPLFSLPTLSNTLDPAAAAPALAAGTKKAVGGSKKEGPAKGKGKKGVKFESGDDPASTKRDESESGGKASSAGMQQTAGAPSATQGASAAATAGLSRLSLDRAKFRSLLLPALCALSIGGGTCYAMLAPAGYLLADLHGKLRAVLHKPKRPAFLSKGPAKPALPTDLSEVSSTQLLETLRGKLPSLRQHLDTSLDAVNLGLSDAAMDEADEQNVWGSLQALSTQCTAQPPEASTFLVVLPDNAAAKAAVSPSAAAPRVATLVLECIRLVLTFPGVAAPAHRGVLQALLQAFRPKEEEEEGGQQASDADVWDERALLAGCVKTFLYFSQLMPSEELAAGDSRLSFEHCHSLLLIMNALTRVATQLAEGLPPEGREWRKPAKMGVRTSRAAKDMLGKDWKDGSSQEGTNGWKGRNAALAELVHIYLVNLPKQGSEGSGAAAKRAVDRLQAIRDLAVDVFPVVITTTTGKPNSEPSDAFPSLCGSTLAVWYRAALEELQALWETYVGEAAETEKARGGMEDDQGVEELLRALGKCSEAFGHLMHLVKIQDKRVAVHTQAVKSGGKFLETFFKALPFWAAAMKDHQEPCLKMVKELQRGTKVIQVLCSEGKTNKELPLTARVPQVKRTVERFVFKMSEVTLAGQHSGQVGFFVGTLKHKNLQGHQVPSQMYPEGEGGSDEEDEDEEPADEYEQGEEEIGETQGDEEN